MFKQSLIAIDIAPYFDENKETNPFPDASKYATTNPKKQNSALFYSELMVAPKNPDFRVVVRDDNQEPQFMDPDEEYIPLNRLVEANNRPLSKSEKKSYDVLVKLEKEVSWGALLEIKNEAFMTEQEQGAAMHNPYLSANFTRTAPRPQPEPKKSINLKEETILKNKLPKIEEVKGESRATEQTKNSARQTKNITGRKKKTYLEEATVEDKQVTFISMHSDGESDEENRVKKAAFKKRIANKVGKALLLLTVTF